MNKVHIEDESLAYTVSYGGRGATIRTTRWRYTRWGEYTENSNEELYDHYNDPEEHINLAQDPEQQEILAKMRSDFELTRNMARTKIEIQ